MYERLEQVQKIHFAGHESFPLRHAWLPKAVNLVRKDSSYLSHEETTMRELGVGKNMARSVKHWSESAQILKRERTGEHRLTQYGKIIFSDKGDPYLERKDTLWLLHYLIASNHEKNGLWHYLFNYFTSDAIEREAFLAILMNWASDHTTKPPSPKTLERDFACCMNMYAVGQETNGTGPIENLLASPMRELRLVYSLPVRNHYSLRRLTTKEISSEVLAFCLLDFWEGEESQNSITIEQILHTPSSPGRIFHLGEGLVMEYLKDFERITNRAYVFDTTAGLQQLLRQNDTNYDKWSFLDATYKN